MAMEVAGTLSSFTSPKSTYVDMKSNAIYAQSDSQLLRVFDESTLSDSEWDSAVTEDVYGGKDGNIHLIYICGGPCTVFPSHVNVDAPVSILQDDGRVYQHYWEQLSLNLSLVSEGVAV